MNTNLIRTNDAVMDGWPILVAYLACVVSFCLFATTMTSTFLAA
jgi:hypothetical protein